MIDNTAMEYNLQESENVEDTPVNINIIHSSEKLPIQISSTKMNHPVSSQDSTGLKLLSSVPSVIKSATAGSMANNCNHNNSYLQLDIS